MNHFTHRKQTAKTSSWQDGERQPSWLRHFTCQLVLGFQLYLLWYRICQYILTLTLPDMSPRFTLRNITYVLSEYKK